MKHLHYWLILVLITVLLFGGTPKLASIEILEHHTYLDWNMAKLTNESAGIIWFHGDIRRNPVLGYQRKVGDTWETEFGQGCGNDWVGWQPLLPGQSIKYEVGLDSEWSRVAARVSATLGRPSIVASPIQRFDN